MLLLLYKVGEDSGRATSDATRRHPKLVRPSSPHSTRFPTPTALRLRIGRIDGGLDLGPETHHLRIYRSERALSQHSLHGTVFPASLNSSPKTERRSHEEKDSPAKGTI